uniref:RIMS binding protein 2 n=1 Tax=Cyprinus carpio TaxID=7962 RepID=A0A8C1ZBP5_CYPCA
MREVAERRQQLELEHEQALAILKFKQDEIKRLQRVGCTLLSQLWEFNIGLFFHISLLCDCFCHVSSCSC